ISREGTRKILKGGISSKQASAYEILNPQNTRSPHTCRIGPRLSSQVPSAVQPQNSQEIGSEQLKGNADDGDEHRQRVEVEAYPIGEIEQVGVERVCTQIDRSCLNPPQVPKE